MAKQVNKTPKGKSPKAQKKLSTKGVNQIKAALKKAAAKKAPVSTAWNAGLTVGSKISKDPRDTYQLNGVRVAGKEYRSVWAAFQALGMGEDSGVSRGRHIKFRYDLKRSPKGKLTFTHPNNPKKSWEFTLLKSAPH